MRTVYIQLLCLAAMTQPISAGWSIPFLGSKPNYSKQINSEKQGLEKRVRQYQDEMVQLRQQIKALQIANAKLNDRSLSSVRNKLNEEVEELKQQLQQLEKESLKLEEIRKELEHMLEAEKAKVEELKQQLSGRDVDKAQLKAEYEKEITLLRKKFDANLTAKLDEYKVLMEKRMDQALAEQKAQLIAEKNEAVMAAENRVRKEADKRIQEEQKKAEEAIEREKEKMRKLVKALAEREKRIVSDAEAGTSKNAAISSSKSGKPLNLKAETVRGNMK
jgi:chromosome segregation ATPase